MSGQILAVGGAGENNRIIDSNTLILLRNQIFYRNNEIDGKHTRKIIFQLFHFREPKTSSQIITLQSISIAWYLNKTEEENDNKTKNDRFGGFEIFKCYKESKKFVCLIMWRYA